MTKRETILRQLERWLDRCTPADLDKIGQFLSTVSQPEPPTDAGGFGDQAIIRVNRGE